MATIDAKKLFLLVVGALVLLYLWNDQTSTVPNAGQVSADYTVRSDKPTAAPRNFELNHNPNSLIVHKAPSGPEAGSPKSYLGAEFSPSDPNMPMCFTKEELTSDDLLPVDKSSQWAQQNPDSNGYLTDKNFLHAGYHFGIDTTSNTLRNANRQLRSEPPNPQSIVSPWVNSTINPDPYRLPLEVGEGV